MPMVYFLAFVAWIVLGLSLARLVGYVLASGNGGPK
jgi:hypothetical protein